jgi:hypothetical protein
MKEIEFQDLMVNLINKKLDQRKYIAYRGRSLLYEINLNENLDITVDPKNPKRGNGAFETDVTIFRIKENLEVPIIVIEVKEAITSHDIITYSNKAQRHKLVYPFLRYGLISYNLDSIPKRFFKHNKEIDFFLAVRNYLSSNEKLSNILQELIKNELESFQNLQIILHTKEKLDFYQKIPLLRGFEKE